jgi:hypothetical protein
MIYDAVCLEPAVVGSSSYLHLPTVQGAPTGCQVCCCRAVTRWQPMSHEPTLLSARQVTQRLTGARTVSLRQVASCHRLWCNALVSLWPQVVSLPLNRLRGGTLIAMCCILMGPSDGSPPPRVRTMLLCQTPGRDRLHRVHVEQ